MPDITNWIMDNLVKPYPVLGILLILMTMDVVSGMCAAVVQRRLSSKLSFAGMMKKTAVMLVIGTAGAIERLQPDLPLLKLVAAFFVVTEALSILENARKCGVPIPSILAKSLDMMNQQEKNPIPRDSTVSLHVKNAHVEFQQHVEPTTPVPAKDPEPPAT